MKNVWYRILRMMRARCVALVYCSCLLLFHFSAFARPTLVRLVHAFPNGAPGGTPVQGPVLLSGSTLYGTTANYPEMGGFYAAGIVFKVNTDGTQFKMLHGFDSFDNDGLEPQGNLVLWGKWLFGITTSGGLTEYNFAGTVYAVNVDDDGNDSPGTYHILWNFGGNVTNGNQVIPDGIYPQAGLTLQASGRNLTLFGTTAEGGLNGAGTVFAITINMNSPGTVLNYQILHSFAPGDNPPYVDGNFPMGDLCLSGNWLYGEAAGDGANNAGVVFVVSTSGDTNGTTPGRYGILHNFTWTSPADQPNPGSGFLMANNTLYGMCSGSSPLDGMVFALKPDTTTTPPSNPGGKLLWAFPLNTNTTGAFPQGDLYFETPPTASTPGVMLGTTAFGGSSGVGNVFAIKTDGTGFNVVATPDPLLEARPFAGVTGDGNPFGMFYGTTISSGIDARGPGTVFGFSLAPTLNIQIDAIACALPGCLPIPISVLDWPDPDPDLTGIEFLNVDWLSAPVDGSRVSVSASGVPGISAPYANFINSSKQVFWLSAKARLSSVHPLAVTTAPVDTAILRRAVISN